MIGFENQRFSGYPKNSKKHTCINRQMSAFGIEIPTISTKSRSRNSGLGPESGLELKISGFGFGIRDLNFELRD